MLADSAPEAIYSSDMLPLQVIHQITLPFIYRGPQDSGLLSPLHQLILVITPGNWLLNLSGPCLRLRDQTTCPSQTDAEAYGSK